MAYCYGCRCRVPFHAVSVRSWTVHAVQVRGVHGTCARCGRAVWTLVPATFDARGLPLAPRIGRAWDWAPQSRVSKPTRCPNCGGVPARDRAGRCRPCDRYYRRHGIARPRSLWDSERRRVS